jgi:hypothetical protein
MASSIVPLDPKVVGQPSPTFALSRRAPAAPLQVVKSPVVMQIARLGSLVDLVEKEQEGCQGPDHVLLLVSAPSLHFRRAMLYFLSSEVFL